MEVEEKLINPDKQLPHIGLIKGNGIGTGFIVKDKFVITASHLLEKCENVYFSYENRDYEMTVLHDCKDNDIAILELKGFAKCLAPLPLGFLPDDLPVWYKTWGYRTVDAPEVLQGHGLVRAFLSDERLQLETDTLRPGMSGCPILINGDKGAMVVAVGYGRYKAKNWQDAEKLAYACSIKPIPEKIIRILGGASKCTNPYNRETGELQKLVKSPKKLIRARNIISLLLIVFLITNTWININKTLVIPIILLFVSIIIILQITIQQIEKSNYVVLAALTAVRSSCSNKPVPLALINLLNS